MDIFSAIRKGQTIYQNNERKRRAAYEAAEAQKTQEERKLTIEGIPPYLGPQPYIGKDRNEKNALIEHHRKIAEQQKKLCEAKMEQFKAELNTVSPNDTAKIEDLKKRIAMVERRWKDYTFTLPTALEMLDRQWERTIGFKEDLKKVKLGDTVRFAGDDWIAVIVNGDRFLLLQSNIRKACQVEKLYEAFARYADPYVLFEEEKKCIVPIRNGWDGGRVSVDYFSVLDMTDLQYIPASFNGWQTAEWAVVREEEYELWKSGFVAFDRDLEPNVYKGWMIRSTNKDWKWMDKDGRIRPCAIHDVVGVRLAVCLKMPDGWRE